MISKYLTPKQQAIGMLRAQYAPYESMRAFAIGMMHYGHHNWQCPYDIDSADGQAFDRGMEFAMKVERLGR